MCYHAEFGRFALKDVGIIIGDPQNWGALELRSLGMGGVADPQDTCHSRHVLPGQFGSSVTKGARIDRREPQKLGSTGMGI